MCNKTETPKLKPLDLQDLLKHAFAAGRLSYAHPIELFDDAWSNYDPTDNSAYQRVLTILTRFDECSTDAICAEVKPLEWDKGVVDWASPIPGVKYVACSSHDGWSAWLDAEHAETRVKAPDEVSAKALMQRDFDSRISDVVNLRLASQVHQEGHDAALSGVDKICDGCGTVKSIDQIKAENPDALSCCPERKMRPITHSDLEASKAAGRAEALREPSLAIFCHPKDDPENQYTFRFIGKERAEQGMRKLVAAGWVPIDFHEYATISDDALDALIKKEAGE